MRVIKYQARQIINMFGHNALSNKIPFNMLNAEFRTFKAATSLPADYTTGDIYVIKRNLTPAGVETNYWSAYLDGAKIGDNFGDNTGNDETAATTSAVNSLPDGSYYVTSDADLPSEGGDSTCSSENREAGATDDVCGDCLSGFSEDATGVCVADVATDESAETNWLLYGGLALAGILGISMMK
jgi:hypothetical protein